MLTCLSKLRRTGPARFGWCVPLRDMGLGVAVALSAAPALALDADRVARTAWEGFKTACGQAVTDPQGYINAAPGLAPAGTRPVASSPDGKVVTTALMRRNVEERVQFLGFSDRMVVFCHISSLDAVTQTALPGDLAEQFLANPQLMEDPNFLARIEQDMNSAMMLDLRAADTAIGTALAQVVAQDPAATIVGGAVPMTPVEEYLGFPYNQGSEIAQQSYHSYGIETRFGEVPVHAIAEVQYGSLWIGMSHDIEAGQ